MKEELAKIPAVGDAIHWPEMTALTEKYSRAAIKKAVSDAAEKFRKAILNNEQNAPSKDVFLNQVMVFLQSDAIPKLRQVVNATGIIVHTNLGRSALAKEAIAAVANVAGGYSSLEYDIDTRSRGSRHTLISNLLCEVTGAQAAIAVNNNAAAVFLALNTLAQGREIPVSRGELVEIGGSFRVPDVMAKSGCKLVEIGTTNKTHPHDYRNAVTSQTAMFLKVHASNYRIMGFTTSVSGKDLVKIGHELDIPVMEDLGSGFIYGPDVSGMRDEPSVADTVQAGLDVITFSGDKLLGGPQAGIILGKQEFIEQMAKNPIARAVRLDKMTLAALEATLRLYRDPEIALQRIPTLKMAGISLKVLREKARRLALPLKSELADFADFSVVTTESRVGGGALPVLNLPSAAVSIKPKWIKVDQLDRALHEQKVPVVGRIESDRYLLDVRTLLDGEAKIVQNAVKVVLRRKTEK